jgi:hypothetical protein
MRAKSAKRNIEWPCDSTCNIYFTCRTKSVKKTLCRNRPLLPIRESAAPLIPVFSNSGYQGISQQERVIRAGMWEGGGEDGDRV